MPPSDDIKPLATPEENPLSDLITIDRMKIEDLDEVLDIEQRCFSMPWTRMMFETEVKNKNITYPLLARWKGDGKNEKGNYPICGYVIFWKILDEIHIGNVAVPQEHRRRKIGSFLIEKIIKLAKEWNAIQITLEVRESNHAAIQLYKRYGFREIAIRRDYYSNPTEDAIVMLKDSF